MPDETSFQASLLALRAALEAARTGAPDMAFALRTQAAEKLKVKP